ncbi:bifunctional metallophosphatase/5'-nucleotidase [Allonocardiopsis opalescens]|uniref:5'-nucleotidase n=1 Tax=Allonocardiopsis opalescens TaxID=1144618 RepID=A0A2T0PTY1_9ACTN|nr:bifunctional metallophosphatase/5'-nucleotidase [Allonocardiopsis opalescens]PRX92353.1 5'-nucleotidase [Allonocardiopsis opalescens]
MRRHTPTSRPWRAAGALAAALTLAATTAAPTAAAPGTQQQAAPDYTLTLLHNNDGESHLTGAAADPGYGGVARFAALLQQLRRTELAGTAAQPGEAHRRGVLTLSSGDNFLAGPQFAASLDHGTPYYDSLALRRINYDATAIGNHEFDFGPDTLADFITGMSPRTPYLSANLDVTAEPALAALADQGRIAAATVVRENGEDIGIIGATTPDLAALSSPRGVTVDTRVAAAVQAQADRLTAQGIDKIVLLAHLQNIQNERALVAELDHVDIVIAGGGHELLADDDTPRVPGDTITLDPATGQPLRYPLYADDADGTPVPIVTTAGEYKYVGRLVATFDAHGHLTSIADRSGPVRVSGTGDDAVQPDRHIQRETVDPVQAHVARLDTTTIATSEVALEGRRDPGVRTQETNLGDLLADALLDAGQDNAAQYGVTPPQIALQNGGGIRNNSLIPAGPVTELDTYAIAPFANFVAVVPDVPRTQVKELLENAVAGLPAADGRYAQIAGLRFTYDPAGTPQRLAPDGTVQTPGTRIVNAALDDGTPLITAGQVVDGPGIAIATNDFSARGGDQYPFRGLPFTNVGLTYQQALLAYITDDLAGTITAADYPEGGEGRITPAG